MAKLCIQPLSFCRIDHNRGRIYTAYKAAGICSVLDHQTQKETANMDIPLILIGAAMIATVIIGIYLLVKANHQIKALQCRLSSMREVDEVRHARAVADGFYDNVLEADITNNTLLGDNCKKLIAQLGLPEDAAFFRLYCCCCKKNCQRRISRTVFGKV